MTGIRIKTEYGATGAVTGVAYSNIALHNIAQYGIVVEQDYKNSGSTGIPTNGVPVTDLTIHNVAGSILSTANPVYILCGEGSCEGWAWKNVSITGGKGSTKCQSVPSGISC
jgi:polygalacturonase